MGLLSKLQNKREEAAVETQNRAEEFITLIRVYYQSVMAVQLGITNMNVLADMALFKRMLKIPTQNNKLGLAEKAKARKILMQDYGLDESFFKEIDQSVKRNCRNVNDIQPYFFKFQGFCGELFALIEKQMQWKFRFSMLFKRMLYRSTQKSIHEIITRSEWKDVSVQKAAWSVRKYSESLGYSEHWMTEFVYHVVLLASRGNKKKK
ncbi:MAG: hypothetical protein LIP01_05270 [Tannerellaceae bacterium]|nr:hypothetical protein [Tannerellaceae bacterium]